MRNTLALAVVLWSAASSAAFDLRAGVAKVDITDRAVGHVHAPCFAKALLLRRDDTTAVLITVDAVAIGEIGRISDDFMSKVRARLEIDLGVPPEHVLINASHCHGIVRADVDELVVALVREASRGLVPVRVGAGIGHEDRVSENRRLQMKDGGEVDMRRAYALPADEDVAAVGPIDPQIGILRVDRLDGRPLAVVYNFACHPIMDPPSRGNSADFPAFASRLIEESLGEGAVTLFVQGCGGDINPAGYKDVRRPPRSEPLGLKLGMSVLTAWRTVVPRADAELKVVNETIALPRGTDLPRRIAAIEAERSRLVDALRPTDIDFQAFLPLLVQHKVAPEHPSGHIQGYLHERMIGEDDRDRLDAATRKGVDDFLANVRAMERLTRLNVNLALLRKHQARNEAAHNAPIRAELAALRVGDFRLVTFPGELTVEVGLALKRRAPRPFTFVAGYTNGYLYYLPTAKQRANTDYAQEDCDCLMAPEWHPLFEDKALDVLRRL